MLKSGLCFLPPLGAKKKYVPCILKYKAHILKFKARIFGCLQTRMNKGFAPNVKCGQNGAMRVGGEGAFIASSRKCFLVYSTDGNKDPLPAQVRRVCLFPLFLRCPGRLSGRHP